MKLIKELRKFNMERSYSKYHYGIVYRVDGFLQCFINQENMFKEDTAYVPLLNFGNEEFLKENNIEYLKDEENNIIPIGIINFERREYNNASEFCVITSDEEDLYKCNKILDNIEKAVKIRYETVKFRDQFKLNDVLSVEIDLN